jgi:hypothetical protein
LVDINGDQDRQLAVVNSCDTSGNRLHPNLYRAQRACQHSSRRNRPAVCCLQESKDKAETAGALNETREWNQHSCLRH